MFDLQSILWMLEIKSNENNYKLQWQTLSGLDKRVEQLTGQKMMDSDHNLAFLPCQNRTDDKVNTHVKPHLAHTDIEEPLYLIFCNLASVSQFPTHLVTETWANPHAQAFWERFSTSWAKSMAKWFGFSHMMNN